MMMRSLLMWCIIMVMYLFLRAIVCMITDYVMLKKMVLVLKLLLFLYMSQILRIFLNSDTEQALEDTLGEVNLCDNFIY